MGLEDVKVIYATAPRGVQVSIPLIRAGAYDVGDITDRLKKAGVHEDELPYVVFSPVAPSSPAAAVRGATRVPGVVRNAIDSPDPKIPVPTTADVLPPMYSVLGPLSTVAVTPLWKQITGCRYAMKRADGPGYVAVQDLQASQFQNPEDYNRINNGRIKLCHGLVWRRAAAHFLRQGDKWVDSVQTKRGMSTTSSLSITASVSYSAYGASASLSATYGYSVTVNTESTVTIEVSVVGVAGESQTAVLWELCRKYVLEVDGVLRDESNPYTVVYIDNKGPHQLLDTWGPNYEIVSDQPTLNSTIFKN